MQGWGVLGVGGGGGGGGVWDFPFEGSVLRKNASNVLSTSCC